MTLEVKEPTTLGQVAPCPTMRTAMIIGRCQMKMIERSLRGKTHASPTTLRRRKRTTTSATRVALPAILSGSWMVKDLKFQVEQEHFDFCFCAWNYPWFVHICRVVVESKDFSKFLCIWRRQIFLSMPANGFRLCLNLACGIAKWLVCRLRNEGIVQTTKCGRCL